MPTITFDWFSRKNSLFQSKGGGPWRFPWSIRLQYRRLAGREV